MCKEVEGIKVSFIDITFENELLDIVKLFFQSEEIQTRGQVTCLKHQQTSDQQTRGQVTCLTQQQTSDLSLSSTSSIISPFSVNWACLCCEGLENSVKDSLKDGVKDSVEDSLKDGVKDVLYKEDMAAFCNNFSYKISSEFKELRYCQVVQSDNFGGKTNENQKTRGQVTCLKTRGQVACLVTCLKKHQTSNLSPCLMSPCLIHKQIKREVKRQVYLALVHITGKVMPWGALTGIRPAKLVHEMKQKGLSLVEIKEKLVNYYFVSKEKTDLICAVAERENKVLEKALHNGVGLYIGIPFCKTRCLYCSFISDTIDRCRHLVPSYLETLKYEIKAVAELIQSKNLILESIYMGGGTPTSLDSENLEDLLQFIESTLDLKNLLEFTLEAGRPDSLDEEKLRVIKRSRVDRISINPQTMNDSTLKLIGRNHSANDIVYAFNLARKIGFDNINMDLIIGLPGEDMAMFEHTLSKIRELDPESLTVHTMAVKKASKLIDEKDKYNLTGAEEAADMVDLAFRFAENIGMKPYYLYRQKNMLGNLENIGYSKPGFESIYNVQIMDETQTILAVGAGAITKVLYKEENRIERAANVKNIEEYIRRIDEMIARKAALF